VTTSRCSEPFQAMPDPLEVQVVLSALGNFVIGDFPRCRASVPFAKVLKDALSSAATSRRLAPRSASSTRTSSRCSDTDGDLAGRCAEVVAALVPRIIGSPVPYSRLRNEFWNVLGAVNVCLCDSHEHPLHGTAAGMRELMIGSVTIQFLHAHQGDDSGVVGSQVTAIGDSVMAASAMALDKTLPGVTSTRFPAVRCPAA
jgi:hypothetical protein